MKIIGVTGKSGAGKSTLVNFFNERENVGVIHIDSFLNDVKEKKFKNQIKSRNKNNSPVLLSDRLRYIINSNRILFKISSLLKKILLKEKIQEELKKFKSEGKDAVVIEGTHLKHVTDYKMFDKMIYVKRPYKTRIEAIKERECGCITKLELVERDLPFKKGFSTLKEKDFDYIIENCHGKEELKEASKKIYDEVVGIKTFDERYKVTPNKPINFKNIVRKINKTQKNSRKRIIDEK